MDTRLKILLLEDEPADRELVLRQLKKAGLNYDAETTDNLACFEKALTAFKPEIILADYTGPRFTGPEAFEAARKAAPEVPFIIVSGVIGEERAVDLIKSGVTDYVLKDKIFTLLPKMKRALHEAKQLKEKLLAKEVLRQTNERSARAQELAHLGTWEVDIESGIGHWSAETCKIYGLDPADNIQNYHSWFSFIHPEDLDFVKKLVNSSAASLQPASFYHRIIRRNGEVRYVYSESKFEYNQQGGATSVYGIIQDLTDRKEAEDKLDDSEAKLKVVFDNSSDYICSMDKDLKIKAFNKAFAQNFLAAFKFYPTQGLYYIDVLPEDKRAAAREKYNQVLQGEAFTREEEFDFGGTRHWFSSRYNPIIRNGEVTGVVVFSNNVTDRKNTEVLLHKSFEELQIASERQSTILNTLPANIALLDANGNIIKVNEAWKKFAIQNGLQHSLSGLGENYIEIAARATGLDEQTGKQMAMGITAILRGTKEKFSVEYPCHSPNQQRWFRAEVRPITGEIILGAVVMHVDITERILAEEEIKTLNHNLEVKIARRTADLERANKELESFSYTVSHDLRAPLQVINGYSSLIEKKYKDILDEDGQSLLKGIKDNTLHMAQLINDLLGFSQIGRAELKRKPLNMCELVNVVISELNKGENFKAAITVNELKPANADGGLLHRVWDNLISNAIKYSQKTCAPQIEIGMKTCHERDVYYVKDNGVGFDMAQYDKLFTVFHRLHKPSEFVGTGVGLALVKSVIAKHGGTVWAESKVNEGATFYFTLPEA